MAKIDIVTEVVDRVKEAQGISGNEQDKYIKQLTSSALDEFRVITETEEVEERYIFVIEGVVLKRYVRRGSEGLESEKTSGVWMVYGEDRRDFEEYLPLLALTYPSVNKLRSGTVMFW